MKRREKDYLSVQGEPTHGAGGPLELDPAEQKAAEREAREAGKVPAEIDAIRDSVLSEPTLDAATRGEAISTIFSRSPLINPSVSEAIRHGEKNGQIGPILSDMADFLDEENQVIVKTAMGILEPLILIVLGVVVGFIALSLFIPLFDLTATAGAK